MDDTLRIIQYLYGEDVDDPDFVRRVAEDDALRRECERLQEVKDVLDRRPSSSPDPEVVDRVVEQAAGTARAPAPDSTVDGRAPDRPAQTPDRDRARRLRRVGAVLAAVLLVGLGWWQWRLDVPASSPTANESAAQQSTESVAASDQPQVQSDDIPEWDDRDDMARLHRRIEALRTRSRPDAWGTDLQTVDQTRP
jgi:hypothetical protein